MDKRQQEFLKRLRETFRVEADEHLRAMSAGLIQLEKGLTTDEEDLILEGIFRESHSLKGAARAVNLTDVESVCQSLEGVFSAAKRRELVLSRPVHDQLHSALSLIADLIPERETELGAENKPRIARVLRELTEIRKAMPGESPSRKAEHLPAGAAGMERQSEQATPLPQEAIQPRQERDARPAATPNPAEKEMLPLPETVRISTAKLNAVLVQAEELVSAKLAFGQQVAELRKACASLAAWERAQAQARPEIRALQRTAEKRVNGEANGQHRERRQSAMAGVSKLLAFSESTAQELKSLHARLTLLAKSAEQDHRALSVMVDRLLHDTRRALMLPFSSFLEAIPKLVRDLAHDSGKEVSLAIHGGEIEVDRRILEELKDPLVHMIRNAIDHALTQPRERSAKGKPPQGTITIAIAQKDGGKVEIAVSDDGSGINLDAVRASGLKSGAVSAKEAGNLDDAHVLSLIFQSGVSTSPIVTDLSGRGLGLAIVREKVDKLGGTLAVETAPNAGTTFRMILPLTLTAFRGVLVRCQEQLLIVPSVQVAHVLRLPRNRIKSVENRETIELEGGVMALVRLSRVLGIPEKSTASDDAKPFYILVLRSAEQQMAFAVDEILEEQEVLVKSLGRQLPRVRNTAGAAVLGNGKVAPVLTVSELMESALTAGTAAREAATIRPARVRRRLLVAEDSITTRTLLKNILESAGYEVKTAVDGVDALTSLRSEAFDLVVSDVDMPRMNGFGLTSALRNDKKLAALPVVLVTALDSREDRERGIDVGASAYIVKTNFEQSNLLEVVKRLL